MEYQEAKKIGDIGEEKILKLLKKKYPLSYIDDTGKANSDWDIWIPELDYGVEVKMDLESKNTGNLVIEVEMNDKLSALSVTKSKYWVFLTGDEYIWIRPLDIYRFIEQHFEYGRVPFIGNGDNRSKWAYLIKLHKFISYVKNLDKDFGWVIKYNEKDVKFFNDLLTKNTPND